MLLLIWIIYFVTDVTGHVALKIASGRSSLGEMLFSVWGAAAVISWVVSGVAWTLVLSRNPLLTANTVSAITYILVSVAALVIFQEQFTRDKLIGVVFVFIGIILVTR
jgi:drug/metabolite transporter (DMT)-like permease